MGENVPKRRLFELPIKTFICIGCNLLIDMSLFSLVVFNSSSSPALLAALTGKQLTND